MGISGSYSGTYSHGISHGNFCFPCGNLFPWNSAGFPIDFLFPLISTGFSLDSHVFSTAAEMPMTFLWFSMVHFGREYCLIPLYLLILGALDMSPIGQPQALVTLCRNQCDQDRTIGSSCEALSEHNTIIHDDIIFLRCAKFNISSSNHQYNSQCRKYLL